MWNFDGLEPRWKSAILIIVLGISVAAHAQTFTTLVNFDGTNGANPSSAVVQGTDGNLYGTTAGGGNCNEGCGTIFRIAPSGILTTLYEFCGQTDCPDGWSPNGIVLGTDGNFYGTTYGGGAHNSGTIFKVTAQGKLTTLYSFCSQTNCIDGSNPAAGLVQGSDGNFYGTTQFAGSNCATNEYCGSIFKVSPAGTLTVLHSFCSEPSCADGRWPIVNLIQGTDGNFYGTTVWGGNDCTELGCGTIFKLTPTGSLTVLYDVCPELYYCPEGGVPSALVQVADGALYGTMRTGGTHNNFNAGTVFKITTQGTFAVLYDFCADSGCTDGEYPYASLIQATDGNLYGTTTAGGTGGSCNGYRCGTIFDITRTGNLTTLAAFSSVSTLYPFGALLQATNGNFYGTTFQGGNNNYGTLFELSAGLGPFVAFVRNPAKVGQTFGILGQGFKSTTGVTLNGAPINFRIMSDTLIEATIPNGATTGYVVGASPHGRLTSNVPFRVLPQLLSFSPPSGPVGTQVTITGVSFTQTKGVGFGDDIGAKFTVNSDTQVTATVPDGAKTGPIGVSTKGGIALSAASFTVTP